MKLNPLQTLGLGNGIHVQFKKSLGITKKNDLGY